MDSINFKDSPFLIIGSSGQEKTLTQEIVNKYNSIAINRCPLEVDIIFRCDRPQKNSYIEKCKYFFTNEEYKSHSIYQNEKCRFFKSQYKIISDKLPLLGFYRFTITSVLNYIAIVKPQSEVYLVGIDHSKGVYRDPQARKFIEQYKEYLTIYQTDFNSEGWNLIYKEIQ